MSLNQLENCPRCGQIFLKGIRNVCQKCFQEEEREYQAVYSYLRKRENKGKTIQEVSDDTGVSIAQITRFIRLKRISIVDLPNVGYPCDQCGNPIRVGNLCRECTDKINKVLERTIKEEHQRIEDDKHRVKDHKYRSMKDGE